MRGALGASRWRVVQQMMVEGLVLSGGAAVLGTRERWLAVKLLAHELSQHLPVAAQTRPNTSILLVLLRPDGGFGGPVDGLADVAGGARSH